VTQRGEKSRVTKEQKNRKKESSFAEKGGAKGKVELPTAKKKKEVKEARKGKRGGRGYQKGVNGGGH